MLAESSTASTSLVICLGSFRKRGRRPLQACSR
jgi:hypothetical protein